MWDRLRSATGGSGSAASPVDQYQGRTTPLGWKDRASTLPSTSSNNNNNNNSSNNSSSAYSTPSWQPRSSVIAARQGQQKQQRPNHTGPPPPRPPREFELQPPFDPHSQQPPRSQTVPPPTSYPRNSIQGRPPSSVYSQPSPLVTDFGTRATTEGGQAYRYATSPDEVSPPSSPEDTREKETLPNHDISPIDEEDDYSSPAAHPPARPLPEPPVKKMASSSSAAHASLPSQQRRDAGWDADRDAGALSPKTATGSARTNIPMMRRERRAQRDAAAAGGRPATFTTDKPRGQKNPRWDPMTGEITNSDKGRPSQVKPVEFARGLGISTMSSTSSSTTTTSGSPERTRLPSRSGSRSGSRTGSRGGGPSSTMNSSSSTDPAATAFGASSLNQRPGWKGASGRTAIVDPVRDNPEVAPLKIPPRSQKRDTAPSRPGTTTATTSTTTGEEQQQQQQMSTWGNEGVGDDININKNDATARLGVNASPAINAETDLAGENKGFKTGVVIGGGGSAGSGSGAETETETEMGKKKMKKKKKEGNRFQNAKNVTWGTTTEQGNSSSEATSTSTSTPTPTASSTPPAASLSTGRSLANALRKIIPSSSPHHSHTSNPTTSHPATSRASRLFSGSGGSSSRNSPTPRSTPTPDGSHLTSPLAATSNQPPPKPEPPTTTPHGYPSPPLSGNAILEEGPGQEEGGGSSSVVNARHNHTNLNASTYYASKFGNASDANIAAKIDNGNTNNDLPYSTIAARVSSPPLTSSEQPYSSYPHTSSILSGHPQPQHQLALLDQPPTPTVRRKEVGSASALPALINHNSNSNNHHHPHHRPQESHSSSVYSHQDDHDHQQFNSSKTLPSLPPGALVSDSTPYVPPPSRFSITTYATSAYTGTSSPRQSTDVAPPLPTPPKDIAALGLNTRTNNQQHPDTHPDAHPDMAATSVLDRQRPQMRGGANTWEDPEPSTNEPPVKISLSKAWMSTAGANSSGKSQQASPPRTRQPKGPRDLVSANNKGLSTAAAADSSNKENRGMFGFGFLGPKPSIGGADSDATSIISNMDKDLPPAPAPAPSSTTTPSISDRIAQLNAQLQDMANRRLNINRAIKQMTELMPQDNLIMPEAVRRKREDEKRKIEELKRKLDDLGREEHELGMKLHRAYKKLDQQTEYEPTTLWVRRATGS